MSEFDENEEVVPAILTSVKQEPDCSLLTDPDDSENNANYSQGYSIQESDDTDMDYIITTQEGTPLFDSRDPSPVKPKSKSKRRRHDEESPNSRVKRRKRCGECGPCQVKENCGTCIQCQRRSVLKQSCIYRKCLYLRKPSKFRVPSTDCSLESQNSMEYTTNEDVLLPDDTALLERPMVLLSPESQDDHLPEGEAENMNYAPAEEDALNTDVVAVEKICEPMKEPTQTVPDAQTVHPVKPHPPGEDEEDKGLSSEDFFQKRIINADRDEDGLSEHPVSAHSPEPLLTGSDLHMPQRELLRKKILERKLSVDGAVPQGSLQAFGRRNSDPLIEVPSGVDTAVSTTKEPQDDRIIIKDILEKVPYSKNKTKGRSHKSERQTSICAKWTKMHSGSLDKRSRSHRSSASPASVQSNPNRDMPYDNVHPDHALRIPNMASPCFDVGAPRFPYHMMGSSASGLHAPSVNSIPFLRGFDSGPYPPRMIYYPRDPRSSPAEMYGPSPHGFRPVYPGQVPAMYPPSNRPEGSRSSTPPLRIEDSTRFSAGYMSDSQSQKSFGTPEPPRHCPPLKDSRGLNPAKSSADTQRQYQQPINLHRQQHPVVSPDAQRLPPVIDVRGQSHPAYLQDGHRLGPVPNSATSDVHRHSQISPFSDQRRLPSPDFNAYRYGLRPEYVRFPPQPPEGLPQSSARSNRFSPSPSPKERSPHQSMMDGCTYPGGQPPPPRLFSPWMPHGIPFGMHFPGGYPAYAPRYPMEMVRGIPGAPMGPPYFPRFPGPLPMDSLGRGLDDLEPGEVRRFPPAQPPPPSDGPRPELPPPRQPTPPSANSGKQSPVPAKDKTTAKPPMDAHLKRYLDDVYKNFTCHPSRPSSLPNKTDGQLSEQSSSLPDYEREMISIDDFHVSAYIRADGTNSVEIEFDQNSLVEDTQSPASCDLTSAPNSQYTADAGNSVPAIKEILVDGKPFLVGLSGTVEDSVVLRQDLGDEGVVQIELPGEKFKVENILLNPDILASSSNVDRLLQFLSKKVDLQVSTV
ncbi:uncharacterized protein LOC135467149 [Liolophura sinensis]|uniref:uncharacterized protein LOC135467149 n=1 Tax=Liolophura sinensis TaxID=3198878 RepID=UPI003158B778